MNDFRMTAQVNGPGRLEVLGAGSAPVYRHDQGMLRGRTAPEPDKERSLLDGTWRRPIDAAVAPFGRGFRRLGVRADHLTGLGCVLAAVSGVLMATGHVIWALVAGLAAVLPDLLDGAVAKASGTTSKRGAYFDSVADRVSDTFLFIGVAWYLTDRDGGHAGFVAIGALAAAYIVSYQRAKAESMGYNAKGGLLERAERSALLGVSVAFAAPLLVPGMWLIFVLSVITAGQRFVKVWKQAEAPPKLLPSGRWRQRRAVLAAQRAEQRRARRAARRSTSATWRQRRQLSGADMRHRRTSRRERPARRRRPGRAGD